MTEAEQQALVLAKVTQEKALDYLRRILLAPVYDVAVETELTPLTKLSARLGNQIFLKREDQQPVHSFKLRGAYNKLSNLTEEECIHGVVAASAGNHAQGMALAAHKLGIKATIRLWPRSGSLMSCNAVKMTMNTRVREINASFAAQPLKYINRRTIPAKLVKVNMRFQHFNRHTSPPAYV